MVVLLMAECLYESSWEEYLDAMGARSTSEGLLFVNLVCLYYLDIVIIILYNTHLSWLPKTRNSSNSCFIHSNYYAHRTFVLDYMCETSVIYMPIVAPRSTNFAGISTLRPPTASV